MTRHRPPRLQHCTSMPYRFFGREAELRVLAEALEGAAPTLVAFVGPGGQGKTAIVQHWLETLAQGGTTPAGLFLWSFYRGKDADHFLRELYAYAEGLDHPPDVSASYCVDHLVPLLRRERWALVLDGTEVVQYDEGPWFGRFLHPELGRLLEELASAPAPGVVALTTRFPLPELARRHHARVVSLGPLDPGSATALLGSLGVGGAADELDAAAAACGRHAKAVELLGTYLVRFEQARAAGHHALPPPVALPGGSDEEEKVAWVLAAFQRALPAEAQDIIALATAFRDPPAETRLLQYLASAPVQTLLHGSWGRTYQPFAERPAGWLAAQVQDLIDLRLLERVRAGSESGGSAAVLDAHPLVRRAFEHALGQAGRREGALARAGFLRSRPDRHRPETLEEAREEVELFHARCDGGLWNEADSSYVALDNPKHRFLAPALERDLLLRFFPGGDWRQPPLWPGFGRYRSLAICFELLGQFPEALEAYRGSDAPLRGDALLALGRLEPLVAQPQVPAPWDALWYAYRAHALCLAGRVPEAAAVARALVPVDVYEWLHVFECLLRAGQLAALDLRSVLYRPPHTAEHRWSHLARQRMRVDFLRVTGSQGHDDLGALYRDLLEAYDRGGMPYERALTRLGYGRWLLAQGSLPDARALAAATHELAARHGMRIVVADACELAADVAGAQGNTAGASAATQEARRLRAEAGYHGPGRP